MFAMFANALKELSEQGSLEQVPNLKAKWILDEDSAARLLAPDTWPEQETVLTCCHYAGNEASLAQLHFWFLL